MSILVAETIENVRSQLNSFRAAGETTAFVPTMGALHEGHLSLMRLARSRADRVVVSIFVNPAQFNRAEDLNAYPRDLNQDIELLNREKVDLLFAPTNDIIYSNTHQTWVENSSLSTLYEGASRGGHFRGVATVVTVLFNIIRPDLAVFGEKDFQQLRIIEELVRNLKLETEIVRGELVREKDGLALSSRNVRLSENGRKDALALSRELLNVKKSFEEGARDLEKLTSTLQENLNSSPGINLDYAVIVDEQTLTQANDINTRNRVLVAAEVEGIRLIDNIAL